MLNKINFAGKIPVSIDDRKYYLDGIKGSAIAFYSATLFAKFQKSQLIICNDREQGLYLYNDLQSLVDENKIFFFPASYKRPYEEEKTANANLQERAEILNHVSKAQSSYIIITFPEALFEKVVTKSTLQKNTFEVKVGEKLSIEFLSEYLQSVHFEVQDFVYEAGQFAIRGGIIDVYSFANDHPFRIELFGDEVESIRTFDSTSQLSEKRYDRIQIVPNVNASELVESKQNFAEYFGEKNIILLEDGALLESKLNQQFEKAEDIYIGLNETVQKEPSNLFVRGDELVNSLMNNTWLEFGNKPLHKGNIITFAQQPQPVFNKNFDMLLTNLIENKEKSYKNYLFTDSQKQGERLQQIFDDISKEKNIPERLFEPLYLSIHEGFIEHEQKIAAYTDHQIFERYHKFRVKNTGHKKADALTLKELQGLHPGDFVVHIDHGIGRYAGLEKIDVNGKAQEAVKLIYKDNDVLYVSIHSLHRVAKYAGKEGQAPRIDKIGSTVWQTLKQKTKRKVKEIAFDLIKLYAKRKSLKGFAFSKDNYLQNELEASFIYEDTPDQYKSTNDVKKDMEKPYPMDRLVCGDVGFGKTEVAIRASFKAVCDSKQVAVLVPTTILALQHYKTFSERLKGFPCNIEYVNRFKTAKEQKAIFEKLAKGEIDILIGTHKLAGKDVKFKDLGLMIIDEEQKFGVAVKEKLKTIKTNVDSLTLTATPIPRTLQFSLMGARDLSVISTPPPNRYPVQTELHTFNEEILRDAITYEIKRGGQIFFIHNKVQSIQEIAGIIQRLVPEARICVGHGQMDGDKLEDVMMNFIEGYYDILIATTIIESGLDIPNANTIIINDSQNFGLSDLHQMRGRVGRSNKKSFCYLFTPSLLTLTNDARKRLKAITEFTDLGSGFQISMRDLDIRGAGDLLGGEQSGFINDMGFETYMKILSEAVEELKEEDWYKEQGIEESSSKQHSLETFSKTFVKETQIDTDFEWLIPDYYISNITERLNLYRELDNISKEYELIKFESNLKDRFGALPKQVNDLIAAMRMRWQAMHIGFEKLILKNGKMLGYFLSKPDSEYYNSPMFRAMLNYAQQHPSSCSLKEQNNKFYISISNVRSVNDVIGIFNYVEELERKLIAEQVKTTK
ncbi:MAG: transcription-repair coupling factor [Bacteroidetes bacterium]|nr:transcription-repair coupling factor [Bacteroidota bacterium]